MRIGILGWDYTGIDPDGDDLVTFGRERGHDTSFFTLEEVAYHPGASGPELTLKGVPAQSYDAVISRAKVYGSDSQDRIERLTMLSNVPGLPLYAPVDAWLTGNSKFLTAQTLAAAGIPTPPLRSATELVHIEEAFEEWGSIVVKPSYGYRGRDVERITDPVAERGLAEDLLKRYPTLLCQPYTSTAGGEYRINVAGRATPVNVLKLPAAGSWRCKTLEGSSFERLDAPDELIDLSLCATRALGLTLAGLDVLPTKDGYTVLEVNCVPGFLGILGKEYQRQALAGVYDWVEEHTPAEG